MSCGIALGDGIQQGLQSAPEHVEQQRWEADVAVRERLRVVLLRHPQPRLCEIAGEVWSERRCKLCYTKRYQHCAGSMYSCSHISNVWCEAWLGEYWCTFS